MGIMGSMMKEGGGISSTRFIMIGSFLTSATIGIAAVFLNRDLSGAATLVAAFLTPVMTAKAAQKFAEKPSVGGQ